MRLGICPSAERKRSIFNVVAAYETQHGAHESAFTQWAGAFADDQTLTGHTRRLYTMHISCRSRRNYRPRQGKAGQTAKKTHQLEQKVPRVVNFTSAIISKVGQFKSG